MTVPVPRPNITIGGQPVSPTSARRPQHVYGLQANRRPTVIAVMSPSGQGTDRSCSHGQQRRLLCGLTFTHDRTRLAVGVLLLVAAVAALALALRWRPAAENSK